MDSFVLQLGDIKYVGKGIGDDVSSGSVGTKELPLFIHVDSDTDWAVVTPSAAGVVVALIVAWITFRVQKTQIRANISNIRHQWMIEFRACASEYLHVLYSVALRSSEQDGFTNGKDFLDAQEKVAILTFRFEMLLSRNDASTSKIFSLDRELSDEVFNIKFCSNVTVIFDRLFKLRELFRIELEDAWLDVQRDLGGSKSTSKIKSLQSYINKKIRKMRSKANST